MREAVSGGKVTIRTVAEDAGVSVAAVSKVLRNAYGVSDALRDKVMKSIDKLDYRPSTAARGMRGRTYNVGLLLVEMQNAFLPSVVDGVRDRLQRSNYKVLIGVGQAQTMMERSLIDSMIDMRMDGVILVAPHLSSEHLAEHAGRIPTVVIGHHEPVASQFDTINSDDEAGARLAVADLVRRGHRDIHMVSLVEPMTSYDVHVLREAGYRAAMQEAGLSERARIWRIRERPGRDGPSMDTFLDAPDRPEAVFCWSDIAAIELINRAALKGIAVPGDLAIVGYDDTPTAALPLINLSSIDQHGSAIGAAAAEAILSRINGRKVAEHLLLTPTLIRRKSS